MKRARAFLDRHDGIVALVCFAISIAAVVFGFHQTGAELGTAPDWIAAIGTAGALLIGALALRTELEDRHDERERRLRAEARKIEVSIGGSGTNKQYWDIEVELTNRCDDFIYGVELDFTLPSGEPFHMDGIEDIGPGERAKRVGRAGWFADDFRGLRWTVTWRDSNELRWMRTHRGEVRRAP